ncbi:hypothetical protein NC651_006590 [Populus alba x Populus x berolinensis]|nr:hypothetical protein NC651_006590 [Populus alba x Populus x berolinensis]
MYLFWVVSKTALLGLSTTSEDYCWTWTPVDRSAGSTAICSRSKPFFSFTLAFFKECQVLRFK